MTQESRIDSGTTFVTSYHYDAAGTLDKLTAPTGGELNITPDPVGRSKILSLALGASNYSLLSNVNYNPIDQVKFATYGNGLTEVRGYDSDGRLHTIDVDDDADGDGMSDAWESAHGLNPNDPSDASLDPDSDGLTNLQEFAAGTDPHDADSDNDSFADGADSNPTLSPAAWLVPIRKVME